MDQDIFANQWQQMRSAMKSWWGKLTDDDFERIGGQKDKLIGWVQAYYGQTREQAQQEVERHLKAYSDTQGDHASYGMLEAPHTAAGLATRAQQLGAAAIMNTDAVNAVNAASAVGDGSESTSMYWQDKGYKDLFTDLISLVRSYPVPLFLVGTGLGCLLARSTKG